MRGNTGFTLIETLIYIALFGMILTGIVSAAYPLMTGAERLTTQVIHEGEAAFVLQKIEHALYKAPVSSVTDGSTLVIDYVGAEFTRFRISGTAVEISEDSGTPAWVPLTLSRVPFSVFTAAVSGSAPWEIVVGVTVGGVEYSQTHYVY